MTLRCELLAAGSIELYFYDELAEPERTEVRQHLSRCGACRDALDDLGTIRAALDAREDVASPPNGDWSAFMAHLEAGVRARPPDTSARHASARTVRPPAPRWVFAAVAMAAALILATTLVLVLQGGRSTDPRVSILTESSPGGGRADDGPVERALASFSGQHFARSKLVVLGLATRDATTAGNEDWQYERDLASSLLSDTRLYRLAAEDRGMTNLAGVMRDLELVLLEASMTQEPDLAGLEQVQRLIRRRDLVTRMNAAYVQVSD
jgi:hypothetical protein